MFDQFRMSRAGPIPANLVALVHYARNTYATISVIEYDRTSGRSLFAIQTFGPRARTKAVGGRQDKPLATTNRQASPRLERKSGRSHRNNRHLEELLQLRHGHTWSSPTKGSRTAHPRAKK